MPILSAHKKRGPFPEPLLHPALMDIPVRAGRPLPAPCPALMDIPVRAGRPRPAPCPALMDITLRAKSLQRGTSPGLRKTGCLQCRFDMDVTEAAAGYPSHWRASGTSQNLPVLAPGFGLSVSCGAFGSATGSLFDIRLVLLPVRCITA